MEQLVNAGIKSSKELAERLLAGEVFWDGQIRVYFDSTYDNPFRFDNRALNGCWSSYSTFKIKTEWYENIPEEGVLCWVEEATVVSQDIDFESIMVIKDYSPTRSYPFHAAPGMGAARRATPVKPSECLGG